MRNPLDWMATLAAYNPITCAVDASRAAFEAAPDWGFVLLPVGRLAIFFLVSVVLALRAFGMYRQAI